MAISDPTHYVTVRRLARFEQKIAQRYAAKSDEYALASEEDVRGFVDSYTIVID